MKSEVNQSATINNYTKKDVIKVLKESDSDTCLLLLPFVGANWTAFSPIIKQIHGDFCIISVNPPGHAGDNSPLLDSIENMADLYLKELKPYLRNNLIICGYSLGCLVTHNILKKIERNEGLNITVIIAASIPPHLIDSSKKISNLQNEQIIQFFFSIGGIPEVLLKEKEVLDIYLPILKADYRAFETYKTDIHKFNVPCFLIYGKDDNFVDREGFLQWDKYFENTPTVYYLNGGHLFIRDNPLEFTETLQTIIDLTNHNKRSKHHISTQVTNY